MKNEDGMLPKRATTLMIRHRGADGKWHRNPAARGANGRVRPGHALVKDKAVPVADGVYEIRYYEDRRVKYTSAGKNAADADAQRVRQAQTASATVAAEDAGLQIVVTEDRKTLKATAAAYIADAEGRGAMAAARMARSATKEFLALTKKTFVDEVRKEDFYRFHAALRKRGCVDRTLANKHSRVTSWLRFGGIDKANIPPKPKYEEALPTIYEPEQYQALLAAADPYMRICILLALKCGLRDQELRHLEFRDLNLVKNTLLVRGKLKWGFRVKDSEQRELPLPDDLVVELRAWQEGHAGKTLVLGTENDRPNSVLLESLKQLADDAKLSCGRCKGCARLKEAGYRGGCMEFTLHRFRRTYLTALLRSGVDVRTVQRLAGHSDLESTLRYLRPASGPELQAKINAVQW